MRAVGLITEYNPFHNGHRHHLQQSKMLADAEVAVAVMSGNFLQRGEAALCDKWRRAEMALAAGVDLVVEIPYLFACNSAPYFAQGAIQALAGIGGIDAVCFGSEAGSLPPLQHCADLLIEKQSEIEVGTQLLLRKGRNYPSARAEILRDFLQDPDSAQALESPNNILGIEYLRALTSTGSSITPLTIARIGAGYHDLEAEGEIASATGVRRMLQAGQGVSFYLPAEVSALLISTLEQHETPVEGHLLRLLLARILRGAESLASIYQVENGLEHRLFEAAQTATCMETLIDGLKARQFTRTRVQRMLCHLLNEVDQTLAQRMLGAGPTYLHLLGCSENGEKFLAASRKKRCVPLVSNYSRIGNQLQRFYGRTGEMLDLAREQLKLELRCSDNYGLLQKGFSVPRQRDYFEPVRRFKP